MRIRVFCRTNKIGSTCETEIDVPDDELDECETDQQRQDLIEDWARTEVFESGAMFEWGWERLP